MSSSWEDRVALVTGGTQGIGKAVVERLLAEGASVAVVARDEARLRELADGRSRLVWCCGDVAAPDTAQRAVDAALDAFGVLDAVISNAGGSTVRGVPDGALVGWDAPDDQWRELLEFNLLSVAKLCRAAVPHLRSRPAPRIVTVCTELVYLPDGEFVPYTAAKAALLAYTKSMSRALADDGILVNAVCPGTVETPQSLRTMARLAEERGTSLDEATSYFCREVRGISLGRLGRPEEIASALAYLASSDCSFTTGAVLRCDGGSVRSPF